MSIFTPRRAFKPFEYPEVSDFKNAISKSYWLVSEWNFISDVQDYASTLDKNQQEVLKRTILAISQVEAKSVKEFWAKTGAVLQKPEFKQVGYTFAESEVRHADAYSEILSVLGLNDEFEDLEKVDVIRRRIDFLDKYLSSGKAPRKAAKDTLLEKAATLANKLAERVSGKRIPSIDRYLDSLLFEERRRFVLTLAIFSLFVENVSLFSQFLIVKSFNKNRSILKDIDNVIQATQQEETVHAAYGTHVINLIKKEFPALFDEQFYSVISDAAREAYQAECRIIDWIFEGGELEFLPKNTVKEYVKKRINDSLRGIGFQETPFETDEKLLESVRWFEEEVKGEVNVDFFYKKPVTYSKRAQAVTAEALF